jgi:hypothetical protein
MLFYSFVNLMGKKAEIRERREKILLLLSRGYSRSDVVKELDITEMTMSRDMQFINETTKRGLFGLAKETLSTMYQNCIESISEIQKECWNIYNNKVGGGKEKKEDPAMTLNQWHRIAALNLLRRCSESKFNMFQNAPALMEVDRMRQELDSINASLERQGSHWNPVKEFSRESIKADYPSKRMI